MKNLTRLALAIALGAGTFFGLAANSTANQIGVTSAVNPAAMGTPPGGVSRTLYLGADVVFNERIKTAEKALAQILFLDRSAVTVGPNSDIVIDEFVYDANTSSGHLVTTMTKGVLRFVGGALSKQEGGVTIKTAVVTIAVRGAVATFEIDPETGILKTTLVFGDNITITNNDTGQQTQIVDNGYTAVTDADGDSTVAPTTSEDTQATNDALTGDSDSDGGSDEPPSSEDVEGTQVVSYLEPTDDPPTPDSGGGGGDTGDSDSGDGGATDPVADSDSPVDNNEAAADQNQQEATPVSLPPAFLTGGGRYLAAGDEYPVSWSPDFPFLNPGSLGLLGGSPDTDSAFVNMTLEGDRLLIDLTSGGSLDLPYGDGWFGVTDALTPLGTASGQGFISDDGQFFAYELTADGDPEGHIFLFGGVPFDPLLAPADGELRMYTVHPDAIQGISMPFISSDLMADTSGAVLSNFYILDTTEATVFLFAGLQIEGQGIDQVSAVVLTAGNIWWDDDAGVWTLGSARRGSVRRSSQDLLVTFSGEVGTVADSDGNAFFGDDGQYFVLGLDPSTENAFGDSYAGGAPEGTDQWYGTRHVTTLDSTVDGGTLSRGERTLNMYSAGITESPIGVAFFWTKDHDPTQSTLTLSASRNLMGVDLRLEPSLHDTIIDEYHLGFGWSPDGSGASAYIDDERYGALHNKHTTSITAYDSTDLALLGSPRTYFFTNTLVPVDGFLPEGVAFCTCAFMEWGYWGGLLHYEYPYPDADIEGELDGTREDYFHLETWVAGVLPDLLDIPTEGVASYFGHAIGDVYRIDLSLGDNYLAVGDFTMEWDFADRLGTATISNFDGLTFGSEIDGLSSLNGREFGGAIGNADLAGELNGSFFTDGIDPVAGVGGDFNVIGETYAAAGTFMGEK